MRKLPLSRATCARQASLLALAALLAACGGRAFVLGEPTPRDAYEILAPTDWIRAGERALRQDAPVTLPFEEIVYFDDDRPWAASYRLQLARGQRLRVEVEGPLLRSGAVFIELFELTGGPAPGPVLVARSDRDEDSLDHELPRGGTFLLRVQPQLGRGGRYRVVVGKGRHKERRRAASAALTFPVAGRDRAAIGSYFGDARDGGSRDHRGVDIFAPAGTEVLAAAAGTVTDVSYTPLGGKVIWLACDDLGLSFYYAHLELQLVEPGERLRAGEVIGRVGNTGNARTTRPHLHFGVYRPGQVAADPLAYLDAARPPDSPRLAGVDADIGALGSWARAAAGRLRFRAAPDLASRIKAELPRNTRVRLIGASERWYRVALADGESGFVVAEHVQVEGY